MPKTVILNLVPKTLVNYKEVFGYEEMDPEPGFTGQTEEDNILLRHLANNAFIHETQLRTIKLAAAAHGWVLLIKNDAKSENTQTHGQQRHQ